MTKQEIFDKVAKHLLTQNSQARKVTGGCAYRGSDGTMCAIGCLIKDEAYNPLIEGGSAGSSSVRLALEASGITVDDAILPFFDSLQAIHDTYEPKDWPKELKKTAEYYDFDTSVLKEFESE